MSDRPEALQQLIAKWREVKPVDDFDTRDLALREAADELEAAWPTIEAQVRLAALEFAHDDEAAGGCYICKEMFSPEECGTPRAIAALQDQLKEKT